jgi:hypothetical protein
VEVLPLKWKRTFLLAFLLLAGFAAGAVAASQIEKVTAYVRHDFQVLLNGKKADVGNILIVDGTSYLPLRSLGNLLGADVAFDAATNTIRVTREEPGSTGPGQTADPNDYDSTALLTTTGHTMTVDGREYPVFSFVDANYKTYYRVRDLERANIDISRARKTKEAVTKEFYVSENELKRVLNPYPTFASYYNRMVIGENDPDRLKAIDKYIEEILPYYVNPGSQYVYFPTPAILLIEVVKENHYEVLALENRDYKKYTFSMKKNEQTGAWEVSSFRREHLGSPDDYMGYYSF